MSSQVQRNVKRKLLGQAISVLLNQTHFFCVSQNAPRTCSYMIQVLAKASRDKSDDVIANPLALYEGGLPTFTDGYDEKHRVHIYWALEEVAQRLYIDSISTGKFLRSQLRQLYLVIVTHSPF